ncbi:MAG: hypothetical protein RIM84_09295 [Alphaproteobacteria bacterium]
MNTRRRGSRPQGLPGTPRMPERISASRAEPAAGGSRQAYFGEFGWLETPVLRRSDLAGGIAGPAIVEEYDATCVIPPGWRAGLDDYGSILLERNIWRPSRTLSFLGATSALPLVPLSSRADTPTTTLPLSRQRGRARWKTGQPNVGSVRLSH